MNTIQSALITATVFIILAGFLTTFPGLYLAAREAAVVEIETLVKMGKTQVGYRRHTDGRLHYPEASPARLLVSLEQVKDVAYLVKR